jgi:hypothetical protein
MTDASHIPDAFKALSWLLMGHAVRAHCCADLLQRADELLVKSDDFAGR